MPWERSGVKDYIFLRLGDGTRHHDTDVCISQARRRACGGGVSEIKKLRRLVNIVSERWRGDVYNERSKKHILLNLKFE